MVPTLTNAGTLVVGTAQGDLAMLTDAQGRFHFEVLAGMAVSARASKPGFLNDEELGRGRDGVRTLMRADADAVLIKLTPEAVITGSVSDAGGEPLEGVMPEAIYQQIDEGRRVWQMRGTGRTDEDGQFRIANLPPGNFYVVAEAKGEGEGVPLRLAGRAGQARGYATTYYPDAPDKSSATVIHLSAGQQMRADFHPEPKCLERLLRDLQIDRVEDGVDYK